MTLMRFTKDPDAILDYQIDWSDWMADGDTISASEWIVDSDDDDALTVDDDSFTDDATTVWLSAGVAGVIYLVTNRITTAGGRVEDRTLEFQVEER